MIKYTRYTPPNETDEKEQQRAWETQSIHPKMSFCEFLFVEYGIVDAFLGSEFLPEYEETGRTIRFFAWLEDVHPEVKERYDRLYTPLGNVSHSRYLDLAALFNRRHSLSADPKLNKTGGPVPFEVPKKDSLDVGLVIESWHEANRELANIRSVLTEDNTPSDYLYKKEKRVVQKLSMLSKSLERKGITP